MVWFQCEDCGENLKKPKLPSHFRMCSASKFSCIDCGVIFGQQNVQDHKQCVTEAEKYGPKGQGNGSAVSTTKSNTKQKDKPEVDINVGLSERPPWFCSLCKTKATSKQTLLNHADGKKHRAKARAFHAAKQQPKQNESSGPDANLAAENSTEGKKLSSQDVKRRKDQDPSEAATVWKSLETENGDLPLKKKRKHHASENGNTQERAVVDPSSGFSNGQVAPIEKAVAKESDCPRKKAKQPVLFEGKAVESTSNKDDKAKNIKWKKLITSALKAEPDGKLKMRKLRKLLLKAIQESDGGRDESELCEVLEQKINSSSRFVVADNYVQLVGKE